MNNQLLEVIKRSRAISTPRGVSRIEAWGRMFPMLSARIMEETDSRSNRQTTSIPQDKAKVREVIDTPMPKLMLTRTRVEEKMDSIRRIVCLADLIADFGPLGVHTQSSRYVVQLTDEGNLIVTLSDKI